MKRCVVALFCALFAVGAHADNQIPVTLDLASDAAQARAAQLPLLLVFAQDHCDYCERLDRDVLNPYFVTGSFDGRAIVRKVMIDSYQSMRALDGSKLDVSEVSRQFKVYVTPTLLFVDASGRELAPRMVGIESMDFYSAYLEQALDEARGRLH